MALIDQQYLKTPFYGSRRMTAWLHGHQLRRLMQLIGLEAIYRRPNTSKPNPGHKVYPYLLRGLEINRVNQVWATDITYIPMARGFLYLVAIGLAQPLRAGLAAVQHPGGRLLCCGSGRGLEQGSATDLQHRPGQPVHQRGLHQHAAGARRSSEHGRQGPVHGPRLRGTAVAQHQVPEEVYLKAYQNGTEARKGIGAYLAFYNQERPHQALGYRSPGQVFQAVSPQRCLLEHPQALPSDEGVRDTR